MTTYFVKATVSESGKHASCSYYTDYDCTVPFTGCLCIPYGEAQCTITQGASSALQLVGGAFKTIDNPTGMTSANFAPAIGQTVYVPMPTEQHVTKGVILLFAQPGVVTSLYASADPQIQNDGG